MAAEAAWSSGIGFELRYWDHWLASRGGTDSRLPGPAVSTSDFLRRPNASTPFSFENRLARHVARRPPREVRAQTHFRVLDVGSGPVPGAGYRMTRPGWSMELFASDALAKPYDQLLAKHGVVPPLRAGAPVQAGPPRAVPGQVLVRRVPERPPLVPPRPR